MKVYRQLGLQQLKDMCLKEMSEKLCSLQFTFK
jgi:hypothetical protein